MKNISNLRTISFTAILLTAITNETRSQLLSQGPNNPGTVTEQWFTCLSCPGSNWINHIYASLPDNMFASSTMNSYPLCFMTTCYYARALQPSGFGFSIPVNATIKGIKAEVLRHGSNLNSVFDTIVQLMKNGTPAGTNHALAPAWPTATAYAAYGDSADLWGTAWTTADINAASFGLFFKPMNHNPNIGIAYVDHVRITVYYEVPTGIEEQGNIILNMTYDAASGSLLLNSEGQDAVLKIYDLTGKQILHRRFSETLRNKKFSVQLPGGNLYLAKFYSGKQETTSKFTAR